MLGMRAAQRRNPPKRAVVKSKPVPAPIEGWDASSALANMKETRAVQLKNWFPQPGYIEVRRGYKWHAWDIVDDNTPVETLAVWRGPASSKMFAAAGATIYDVTSNAAGTSAVTGLSSARWQWINHTTSAGAYLWMCNGIDTVRHYNGSTWAAPALTGVTSDDVVQVAVHKKRIWMVVNDSTKAYYLATEAIAGAATSFELGSNFSKGGHLLAIATWTRDGGAGSDDYFVAISSEGQIALYSGTDPASASTWSLVGVFDVPTPIGRRCFTRYGADMLLLTVEGVFPLSQLMAVDQSQVDRVAISARISNAFNLAAQSYAANFGWEIAVYPYGTRLIVNIPTTENSASKQYVMNTLTGAWCEFDSHNANCWAVFNNNLYFGGNNGDVYRADVGRADIDNPIVAVGQSAYSALGTAQIKRFSMLRPMLTATGSNRPALGISTDFVETQSLSTLSATATAAGAVWDSASWDSATWGGEDVQISDWSNLAALGTFGSVKFQAQTGRNSGGSLWGVSLWGRDLWGSQGTSAETMRLQGFVILYEPGEYI